MSTLKEKLLLPFNIILLTMVTLFLITGLLLISGFILPLEFITRKRTYHPKIIKLLKFLGFQLFKTAFAFYINEPIHVIYDKNIKDFQGGVVISNHLTNFDWWHYLIFMNHLGKVNDITFIAKEELSHIPFISYLLKILGVVFVRRAAANTHVVKVKSDVNSNVEKLRNDLEKRLYNNSNITSIIFPEGTVLCEETLIPSKNYVKKENIKLSNGEDFLVKDVLCPKSGGFQQIIESGNKKITDIMDCTLISSHKNLGENGKYLYDDANIIDIFIKRTFNLSFDMLAQKEDTSFLEGITDKEEIKKAYKSFLLEKFAKKGGLISKINNLDSNLSFDQKWNIINKNKDKSFVHEVIPMYSKWNILFFCFFYFPIFSVPTYSLYNWFKINQCDYSIEENMNYCVFN